MPIQDAMDSVETPCVEDSDDTTGKTHISVKTSVTYYGRADSLFAAYEECRLPSYVDGRTLSQEAPALKIITRAAVGSAVEDPAESGARSLFRRRVLKFADCLKRVAAFLFFAVW